MKEVDKTTTPPGFYRYTEPATNVTFEKGTWNALIGEVAKHRAGMMLDLSIGWQQRIEDEACNQNPHWNCRESSVPPIRNEHLEATGRALWAELHGYSQAYPETPTDAQKREAEAWMNDWLSRVPNYGCGCRDHASRFFSSWRPELDSRASFVRWAEVLHSWVSRRIGKPIMFEEQYNSSPAVSI